jgi:hypothetical protein
MLHEKHVFEMVELFFVLLNKQICPNFNILTQVIFQFDVMFYEISSEQNTERNLLKGAIKIKYRFGQNLSKNKSYHKVFFGFY